VWGETGEYYNTGLDNTVSLTGQKRAVVISSLSYTPIFFLSSQKKLHVTVSKCVDFMFEKIDFQVRKYYIAITEL